MTLEEFALLDTPRKWEHIATVMDYITDMDRGYSLRVRVNPHHPEEQRKEEAKRVRLDQYQRWTHLKDLYASHRDELANTLETERYQSAKSILERIFTAELDDALRDVIDTDENS